jgi:hypothetical protein
MANESGRIKPECHAALARQAVPEVRQADPLAKQPAADLT